MPLKERERKATALEGQDVEVWWDWQEGVANKWYPAKVLRWRWKEASDEIEHEVGRVGVPATLPHALIAALPA